MRKYSSKDEMDIKWEKTMRYYDLSSKYWEIRKTLWEEYPEKMRESTKNLASICLKWGLIKCKHEE